MATPALTFAVTWDYRCPFARNAHEHVLAGLADGAPWDVSFVPFSLGQMHVEEGAPSVWDDPSLDSGLLALQVGTVVRDLSIDAFSRVHLEIFAARHDRGLDVRRRDVLADIVERNGVDVAEVFEQVDSGESLATVRKAHEAAEQQHTVWGVPTFVSGDAAVFVRLMHRPEGDAQLARRTVERVLDLVDGWPDLNELKHTTIPR